MWTDIKTNLTVISKKFAMDFENRELNNTELLLFRM
jgi:hypothetical protein